MENQILKIFGFSCKLKISFVFGDGLMMDTGKAFRKLIEVVVPVLIAQLSTVGMNFIDTTMSGHAGAVDLAGVSVGSGLFAPILIATIGLMSAATPMVAQLLGRRKQEEIPEVIRTGMILGILLSCFLAGIFYISIDTVMSVMALTPDVECVARYYLLCMVICIFFESEVLVLRALTDTVAGTKLSMRLFLLALPIDAFLNYIFIFGNWGAPRLGGIGAGIATVLTYVILFLMFLFLVWKEPMFGGRTIFSSLRTRSCVWREYLAIGLPNSVASFMEASLFGFIVIFIAPFGTTTLAAHQAATNFSSVTYMIPLSFSMALTILIGVEVGAGHFEAAKMYRRIGILSALTLAVGTSILTATMRYHLAGMYTADADVLSTIAVFMLFGAAWQCFDAIAAPIQGILRGYKDTKVPSLLMMLAYWCICFPVGFTANHHLGWGAISYWLGLDVGVGSSAFLLCIRLWYVERKYRNKQKFGNKHG